MPIAIPLTPSSPSRSPGLELLFLGTGESVATPYVSCLTADTGDGCKDVCRGCTTALDPITQHPLTTEAGKNARGNTSAIVRRTWSPQDQAKNGGGGKASSVILIDCGKTFLSSAIKYMQRHGIREIDGEPRLPTTSFESYLVLLTSRLLVCQRFFSRTNTPTRSVASTT